MLDERTLRDDYNQVEETSTGAGSLGVLINRAYDERRRSARQDFGKTVVPSPTPTANLTRHEHDVSALNDGAHALAYSSAARQCFHQDSCQRARDVAMRRACRCRDA
eukprot:4852279-Pleurochrysis_carterae.AAC.2